MYLCFAGPAFIENHGRQWSFCTVLGSSRVFHGRRGVNQWQNTPGIFCCIYCLAVRCCVGCVRCRLCDMCMCTLEFTACIVLLHPSARSCISSCSLFNSERCESLRWRKSCAQLCFQTVTFAQLLGLSELRIKQWFHIVFHRLLSFFRATSECTRT